MYFNLLKRSLQQSKRNAKRIFVFDSIRIHKLMEIIQYSILAFILAFLGASTVNYIAKRYRPFLQVDSTFTITIHLLMMTVMIVLLAKYIPKIIRIVPFLFWFDPEYKPDHHGEAGFGINAAMGLAFYTCIFNYYDHVAEFAYRIFPGIYSYQAGVRQFCRKNGSDILAYPTCESFGAKRLHH